MDPLTAFGFAGTIVQFVDFCGKLVLGTREVYRSGSDELVVQAEAATKDLLDFTTKLQLAPVLQNSTQAHNENEEALRQLCGDCSDVARDMLHQLSRLKMQHLTPPDPVPPGASLKEWDKGQRRLAKYRVELEELGRSLRIALRSMWTRKELEELESRLEKCKAAIQLRMLAALRNEVQDLAIEQSKRFASLDRDTKRIVGTLLDDMKMDLSRDIQCQIQALAQMMSRQNIVVIDRANAGTRVLIDTSQSQPGQQHLETQLEETRQNERNVRLAVGREILQELHFEAQTERYEAVHEAHARTFGWIFERQPEDSPYNCFVTWLESSDGLYWISGKAGSGKSTLMRYIWDDHRTNGHLLRWSKDKRLILANFYFWNIGSRLQKSQIGLLRSLLHQVLEQVPDLIPVLFPRQWANKYAARTLEQVTPIEPWSLRSLSEAWNAFIHFVAQEKDAIKLCVFVDGLDEFDGLDADMAKLFSFAADMQNVKICASSRPHVVFENAFLDRPSLRLQDLTYGDIQEYVEDRLVRDPSMQELSRIEPVEAAELVGEIVSAADGVFLWVYLVVESLLRGLGHCDEISDLKRKLRLLPKDLKQLFFHIIQRVDDDYKEEAGCFFQLVNAIRPTENDSIELRPMTLLSLCLAREPIKKLPKVAEECVQVLGTKSRRCHAMNRRLQSRTGGLLEVQLLGERTNIISPSMRVGYLHRTVRDFLTTDEMKEVLQAEAFIDPDYDMLKASVYEIQIQPKKEIREELCRSAFQYARRAELRNELDIQHDFLLDQLYSTSTGKYTNKNDFDSFLEVAIQWDLHSYVRRKLASDSRLSFAAHRTGLLYVSLKPEYIICPKMILTLLSVGPNPWIQPGEAAQSSPSFIQKPLFQERLVLFHKIIEYLRQHPIGTLQICYPEVHERKQDQPLHDWARILQRILGVAPERAEGEQRPISEDLRRASETINSTFREVPTVRDELLRCLAAASPRQLTVAKPFYAASRPPKEKAEEQEEGNSAQEQAQVKKFCCFQ